MTTTLLFLLSAPIVGFVTLPWTIRATVRKRNADAAEHLARQLEAENRQLEAKARGRELGEDLDAGLGQV